MLYCLNCNEITHSVSTCIRAVNTNNNKQPMTTTTEKKILGAFSLFHTVSAYYEFRQYSMNQRGYVHKRTRYFTHVSRV